MTKDSNSMMIFIVGASRSGTTMMSRILGKNTQIFSLNELHVFGDLITAESMQTLSSHEKLKPLASKILQRQQYGIWGASTSLADQGLLDTALDSVGYEQATAANVFEKVVLTIAADNDCAHASEQTPRNIFFAQTLLDTYPNAHIVHMVRDPRAVLASQKSKWRRKFLGGDAIPMLEALRMWVNYHPITLSKLWVNANRVALKLKPHKRFHVVNFEALLQSPVDVLEQLCDSIGIEFEAQMMDIEHVGSSHQHNVSEASGISNTTVESWRKSLTPAEQFMSEKMCAELMTKYGYTLATQQKLPLLSMLLLLIKFPLHVLGVAVFNFKRAIIQLKSISNRS